VIAGLSAVEVARHHVEDLGQNNEVRCQSALQRQIAKRDGTVKENRRNEQLRREKVEDPSRNEQPVTE
jgi:hypothetical protein